ncbi:MAG: hypothetical protein QW175_00285 [Candidatus Bathyarchaeia archaeon]
MKNSVFKLALFIVTFTTMNLNMAFATLPKDAFFSRVNVSEKILSGTVNTWTFTVHNRKCSENDDGDAWFFLRFYIDGEIWWDEYKSTSYKLWLCRKGENVTRSYSFRGLEEVLPVAYKVKVELYWWHMEEAHKEDELSFTVVVTMIIPLRHIYATSYFAFYLILCSVSAFGYYVSALEQEQEKFRKPIYVDEEQE